MYIHYVPLTHSPSFIQVIDLSGFTNAIGTEVNTWVETASDSQKWVVDEESNYFENNN